MQFYHSIAHYYDQIFPFNPKQKAFILDSLNVPNTSFLLEIGCAAGSLTLGLAEDLAHVTGIDLDESLISLAHEKQSGRARQAHLFKLDMRDIDMVFTPSYFDTVCSFGNTIVHLNSLQEMLDLFTSVRNILRPEAPFHIQIINYDRILDNNITSLPTIENEQIRFERRYTYNREEHLLEFATILTDKQQERQITGEMLLYPLRRAELHTLLREAGFTTFSWYGDFDRGPLKPESIPLIVTAG